MFAARYVCIASVCGLVACAAIGCGDGRPVLVPATGTVMHKGKGLTSGSLIFFPENPVEAQDGAPSAMLEEDGTFIMKTYPFGNGIVPGKYKVCLSTGLANGIKLPDYGDPKKTPWEIEISDAGDTNLEFETQEK